MLNKVKGCAQKYFGNYPVIISIIISIIIINTIVQLQQSFQLHIVLEA
jgi:hypothetical protein